jgi:2,3-bisphosphoglycerate-dependent phosphoglycerate mutase
MSIRRRVLSSLVLLALASDSSAFAPVPIVGGGGGSNSQDSKNGAVVSSAPDLSKTASSPADVSSASPLTSSAVSSSSGEEDEDGWKELRKEKRPAIWRRALKKLAQPARAISQKAPHVEPGTLILVRHGESLWNANKTFTGWADPDLSERGFREVQHAARLLLEGGYEIDVVFTSRLKRAIRSSWVVLKEMNQVYLPVFKSWRLNERMYGGLTGLGKSQTAVQLGATKVQEWRGSLHSRPPALQKSDAYWPGRERKYADLSPEQIPLTESLKDCMDRTQPVWENKIMYELRQGKNVLVVAHANTLRGLVKTIDDISDENIKQVAIPTGIPIVYKFEPHTMKSIPPSGDRQTASQVHMKGLFLEKPGLLKEALQLEEQWKQQVPGYDKSMIGRDAAPLSSLELSLNKLREYRQLGEWAEQFVDPDAEVEDDGNDGNMGRPIQLVPSVSSVDKKNGDDSTEVKKRTATAALHVGHFVPSAIPNGIDDESFPYSNMISTTNQPCVKPIPEGAQETTSNAKRVRDPVIVIIRHGKTEHNKLKLFTGWEDAPLAKEGIEEAREAGRLLKKHGFEFDVVYTSWLSRAIETAWLVIDELDSLWLPIVKTWRLNER